ncbi:MAG: type II toxin-antitoxin system RelE/ParE family toxin [Candidatus Competibacteraceae bacterium]
MKLLITQKAERDYRALPSKIQQRVDKQFKFLLQDLRYPSLHAKKYDENRDIWQGRVDRDYRFYFRIDGDLYVILAIIKHPK